jgi:hypothetical protein
MLSACVRSTVSTYPCCAPEAKQFVLPAHDSDMWLVSTNCSACHADSTDVSPCQHRLLPEHGMSAQTALSRCQACGSRFNNCMGPVQCKNSVAEFLPDPVVRTNLPCCILHPVYHMVVLQVILIHLSNLTGLGQYNKRTMRLLVSDIGTSEWTANCACCLPRRCGLCHAMLMISSTSAGRCHCHVCMCMLRPPTSSLPAGCVAAQLSVVSPQPCARLLPR